MEFEESTVLNGVVLVKPNLLVDSRGFFFETYKESTFDRFPKFVQDNQSYSKHGVFRGLHFQYAPKAQGKLIRCTGGGIMDFAFDLRKDSPTYKMFYAFDLNDVNNHMLYLPEGFAHGFFVYSTSAMVQYKCSNEYSKEHDGGIHPEYVKSWFDLNGIDFSKLIISDKDLKMPKIEDLKC